MRLYAGKTSDFISDVARNQIATRLEQAFLAAYRYKPSAGEVRSWQESLMRLSATVSHSGLTDNGVILEYRLPLTSRRIDAMLTGEDVGGFDQAVIVELKQWQKTEPTDAEGMINTWIGGSFRDVLHPSVQANGYRDYLSDMNSAFHEDAIEKPIRLSACAYLHNYKPGDLDPIFAPKFYLPQVLVPGVLLCKACCPIIPAILSLV